MQNEFKVSLRCSEEFSVFLKGSETDEYRVGEIAQGGVASVVIVTAASLAIVDFVFRCYDRYTASKSSPQNPEAIPVFIVVDSSTGEVISLNAENLESIKQRCVIEHSSNDHE